MPRTLRLLCAFAACLSVTGCATVVNGSRQTVGINSTPNGATIKVDGGVVGKTPWTGRIERREQMIVALELEGYDGYLLTLHGEGSGWVAGNLFTCSFFGTTTDFSSGGAYEYEPGSYHVALEKTGADKSGKSAEGREVALKRFILGNHSNLVRQIQAVPQRGRNVKVEEPEHLRTLRGLMGMDDLSDQQFRDKMRPAADTQLTPDGFAEAALLMMQPAQPKP
jgi:hypothetical protein